MTREEKIICKEFLDDADKTHSCNEYKLLMTLLEQEPTTKNDLAVDCRSLKDIKKLVERKADDLDGVMLDAGGVIIGLYFAIANDLPSVTPQDIDYKAQYERLSQKAEIVISQLRADRDRLMSLTSVTPQEPQSEWQNDHEILKAYSDGANEVLDKIRTEIEHTTSRYCISRERGGSGQVEWSDRLIKESEVLEILDKYKAEKEQTDGKRK